MKYKKEEVAEFLLQSNYIEDERSVQAYEDSILAWNWADKNKNRMDKMGLNYILNIHWFLTRNIAPYIAGKIRDCDVYIGGECKRFITESLIREDLEKVLKLIESDYPELDKEKEAFMKHCHVAFENVHPFVDGNGRTGRILMNIHRLKMGLPIHIIHADWPKEDGEQKSYYKWFKN